MTQAGELRAPLPLSELPILDLFSERTSQVRTCVRANVMSN